MLRAIGKFIWRFMVIFSFIVNIVLVVVLLVAGIFIFEIKNHIADPLVQGLHSTAQGLDQATIDWTIPVRDTIPVKLNVPLDTTTTVILTEPVPLQVNALIDLPGINAYNVTATVNLTLPAELELPVALKLDVPIDEELDVALDVRAVIPLSQTQLHDPIQTLGLLFEPLALGLHNLPDDFNEAGNMVSQILGGQIGSINLLKDDGTGYNPESYVAWPGFSRTAGLNYDLLGEPWPAGNIPVDTGIIPIGGIPALDEQVREDIYKNRGVPEEENSRVNAELPLVIPGQYFLGTMGEHFLLLQGAQFQPPEFRPGVDTQAFAAQIVVEESAGNGTEGEAVPLGTGGSVIPTPGAPQG